MSSGSHKPPRSLTSAESPGAGPPSAGPGGAELARPTEPGADAARDGAKPPIPRELIDAEAQKVIRHLVRSGYEAYLVGGCVRDLLVDRRPKDFDVATSATPSEIRDLFRNCRIIGRRFRLAHIVFGKKVIETATFRRSPREDEVAEAAESAGAAAGTPGREDLYIYRDNVFGTAEEDARRRDFTINGLFYDLSAERVIDYVGGLGDLGQRQVRTIGDPSIRFREDPVRMLRAVKFAARLGFDIEDQTYRALLSHRGEVQKSPVPRVLEEIFRLLRGGAAVESLVLLREIGLLPDLPRERFTQVGNAAGLGVQQMLASRTRRERARERLAKAGLRT